MSERRERWRECFLRIVFFMSTAIRVEHIGLVDHISFLEKYLVL